MHMKLKYGLNIFMDAAALHGALDAAPASDGVRCADARVRIMPFAAARQDVGIAARVASLDLAGAAADDPVNARLSAAAEDAVVVRVPDGVSANAPILMDGDATRRNVFVLVGEGARAQLFHDRAVSGMLGIVIDAHGALTSGWLHAAAAGTSTAAARVATLADGARLHLADALLPTATSRITTQVRLAGTGASCTVAAAAYGDNERRIDYHCRISHEAAGTSSDVRTAFALDDAAKAVCRARARVAQIARGSDVRQSLRMLQLGERAEADPLPELEIGTADVRCSHAASVGAPDEAALFYLASRGLPRQAAIDALTESHLLSVLRDVDDCTLRDALQSAFRARRTTH